MTMYTNLSSSGNVLGKQELQILKRKKTHTVPVLLELFANRPFSRLSFKTGERNSVYVIFEHLFKSWVLTDPFA